MLINVLKLMVKLMMPKKGEYIKFKLCENNIKLTSIIYVDFECILVSEDNGNQNEAESYMEKYQKDITCSYGLNYNVLIINLMN